MLGLGLGLTSPAILGGGAGTDADALALFAAWTAAGVPASDADKTRANTLIVALKSAGIWNSLTVLQVYGVHASAAALINWKTPGTHNAVLTGGPAFTPYAGYVTDGVDDAVLVFNPSGGVLAQDDFHTGVWLTSAAQNSAYHYGWYDGTDGILLNARTTSDQIGVFASVVAANLGLVTGITTAAGLTAINRSASNAVQVYRDGVAQTMTNATAASVAINNHALQVGNTSTNMVAHALAAVAGASLSAAGHLALYNALNAFKASLLWHPMDLGVKVKAWWSADDHGTGNMTDDGSGLISAWKDRVSSINCTGTTTARPTWAAASFNSAYAGLTFDGTANTLAATSFAALPLNNDPCEIWCVVNQAALTADATQRYVTSYGTATTFTRRLFRAIGTGLGRVHGYANGSFLIDTATNFVGNFIVGVAFENLVASGRINGSATSPATAVLPTMTTSATRIRIGAMNDTAAATFWQGPIRHVMVTTALTSTERQKLEGWMAWDSGLVASLPGGHPYKSAAP